MITVDMHAHPLLDRYYVTPGSSRMFPIPPGLFGSHLSIGELVRGQVGVVVSSVYPFWSPARGSAYLNRCRDILTRIEAYVAEHRDQLGLATTPETIEHIVAQGKIALIHAVEGGHVIDGRVENLEKLHEWGVRSLTLTHFLNNQVAASAFDPRRKLTGHDGLTGLGREVVHEMNARGMVIDLAHGSERAFWDVMELTTAPIIVSHTGVRHFVPWEICLSDDQIRALGANGGILGIILSGIWLKRFRFKAGLDDLADNVLHVCSLVGADHVGFGSDFNGTPAMTGVRDAGDFPRIAQTLVRRGLSQDEVAKVMGGSFMRLYSQVVKS